MEHEKAPIRRRVYAEKLTRKALERLCEVRDFACSNARAEWMPEDEIELWDAVEIKAESIRSLMDDLIELVKKGEIV